MDIQGVLAPYVQAISQSQTGHWLAVGATCLSVYDWLVCLDLEYRYVWKATWSSGKVLYFIHRYPVILFGLASLYFNTIGGIPVSWCKVWVPTENAFDLSVVFFLEVTLTLRVYALYEKNRNLLVILIVLLISCICLTSIVLGLVMKRVWFRSPIAPLVGCLPDCRDCYLGIIVIHIPLLVFDAVVVGLTLAKCFRYFTKGRRKLPTISIVFRDGLIYYLVSFIVILLNIFSLSFAPAAMASWFLPWMRVIIAIMGTRLLLNLRGQIQERRQDTEFFVHTANLGTVTQGDIMLDSMFPISPTCSVPGEETSTKVVRSWNLPSEDDLPRAIMGR